MENFAVRSRFAGLDASHGNNFVMFLSVTML